MLSIYPACFYCEENGYSVVFPDLNYLATNGETLEEAMCMAVDCLAGYLYSCGADGEEIPAPSAFGDVEPEAVAKELDCESSPGQCFVNLVAVDVASYARDHFAQAGQKFQAVNKAAEPF